MQSRFQRISRLMPALMGAIVITAFAAPLAGGSGFELSSDVIAGGGGVSAGSGAGGNFQLVGTIGQHDAGASLVSGSFILNGGFWGAGGGNTPGTCTGDIDGDGEVGFSDLVHVLDEWGATGVPEDIDGSGLVDFGDLLLVLARWGSCP